ncbi:hypothetical protein N0V90_007401 [Kalmusia sp. IMI 367209]|nr:hypothetical protein N0V90_007401 [Kalmusia sp. IMI 367209]
MADPLSITASVVTLIQVSIQVSLLLRQFRDDVNLADVTLTGLYNDVEGFQRVLESTKETFDQHDIRSTLQITGHVGNHWKNLARSLKDGAETLQHLRELLDGVNKNRSFLESSRKALRLRGVKEQIKGYREQIQSYRGALQLSLSTVILWNQVTFQKTTDRIPERILPNLDKLYDEFRSFGTVLNDKIEQLQIEVSRDSQQQLEPVRQMDTKKQLKSMQNLRDCVRSAADVASTASTTISAEASDNVSVKHGSDFGDIFTSGQDETVLQWVQSNTILEVESSPLATSNGLDLREAPVLDQPDSESDIESDVAQALLTDGKKRKEGGDLAGAARHFRNCLSRLPSNTSISTSSRRVESGKVSRDEVFELLIETYRQQGAWANAKAVVLEKLKATERQLGTKDKRYLLDNLQYAEILMYNKENVEAHLQARRSLRGFKKLGELGHTEYERCLQLLIHLSKAEGKSDDEEGYIALLISHRARLNESLAMPEKGESEQLIANAAPVLSLRKKSSAFTPLSSQISSNGAGKLQEGSASPGKELAQPEVHPDPQGARSPTAHQVPTLVNRNEVSDAVKRQPYSEKYDVDEYGRKIPSEVKMQRVRSVSPSPYSRSDPRTRLKERLGLQEKPSSTAEESSEILDNYEKMFPSLKLYGPNPDPETTLTKPIFQVKATVDYTTYIEGYLDFKIGQIISVVNNKDPEWYGGYTVDKNVKHFGMFPSSLVTRYEPTQLFPRPPKPESIARKSESASVPPFIGNKNT